MGVAAAPGESPLSEQPHDSFILTSAPLEMISEEQATTVHCWKTMYNLLELYSTMPTTKTVQRQSLTPVSNNMQVDAPTKRAVTPTATAASAIKDPLVAAAPAPLAKTPEAAEAPPLPPTAPPQGQVLL